MGTTYELINVTKQQRISFPHLPVSKKKEICGNPVSAAIVSWYLLNNSGDEIKFVSEFEVTSQSKHFDYAEVTNQVINELIENGILKDEGMNWVDEEEPNTVYIRSIKNVWMDE